MTDPNYIPSFTRLCDFALCGQQSNVYLGNGGGIQSKEGQVRGDGREFNYRWWTHVQRTYDMLRMYILKTYTILLTNVASINLIFKKI